MQGTIIITNNSTITPSPSFKIRKPLSSAIHFGCRSGCFKMLLIPAGEAFRIWSHCHGHWSREAGAPDGTGGILLHLRCWLGKWGFFVLQISWDTEKSTFFGDIWVVFETSLQIVPVKFPPRLRWKPQKSLRNTWKRQVKRVSHKVAAHWCIPCFWHQYRLS